VFLNFKRIFGVQFLVLIAGIAYAKGQTVPTLVSMTLSFSFMVFAIILAIRNNGIYSKVISIASLFCFAGDLILANVIKLGFIAGMGVFTVAQAINMIAFVLTSKSIGKKAINTGFWVSLMIYVISVATAWWVLFKPTSSSELIVFLVLIYGVWVSVMAALAAGLSFNDKKYIFSAVGGLSFLVSDLIAGIADVGGIVIPYKVVLVWITYVIALGGIIYSKNFLEIKK